MPFFIRKKQGESAKNKREKRKKTAIAGKDAKKAKKEKLTNGRDEIISSDDDDEALSDKGHHEDDSQSEEETEQEKKLRLTKKYLEELEKQESEKVDLEDDTREAVAKRLKEEALEEAGRLQKKVAQEYENIEPEVLFTLKGHKLSITCLVISSCEKFVWSGSKDCSIIKWSVESGKKVKTIPGGRKGTEATHVGHTSHILSLAISHDDKFLASGCQNRVLNIWNPDTMELLKTFRAHKGSISGLVFQRGNHQLMSASSDRSLKLWNLDEMGYIETLFGHQDGVTAIDSFHGEMAVTSGGRDNTVRIWKIVEESQLVFQGHGASIDCVCVSGPQTFVSGADDGSLCLWGSHKKKPLSRLAEVHGRDPVTGSPHWITCVSAMQNSDLLASGSQSGEIKLWRRDDEKNLLHQVRTVPVVGFVNALRFSLSGRLLVVGIGQEHKLGRWWRIKEAKNSIVIYSWPRNR